MAVRGRCCEGASRLLSCRLCGELQSIRLVPFDGQGVMLYAPGSMARTRHGMVEVGFCLLCHHCVDTLMVIT